MASKVRLGIVGLGVEGLAYADFISSGRVPNMEIGAVSDVNPALESKANEYGVKFFTDYKELITSGLVDAVVTTVPHYLHPEVGIYALEHGVHALVEKPVGVYTKQAQRLIDVARSKPELKFGVFFNQRTNQLYKDLRPGGLRRAWCIAPHQLDYHQLVAPTGLLRHVSLACDLGWRGRWGSSQPGTSPARSLAVDLWCSKVSFRQGAVWFPQRHCGRG